MNTNFFVLAILLALISSYLNNVSGQRQRCLGNYCSGSYRTGAVCKGGYCVCNSQDYDHNTCLSDAYGCKIEVNSATALAKPNNQQQLGYSTYSCTPSSSSTQYEVHVLSVYEVINRRPPTAGNANVNIVSRGKSNRPIVLVLASYEPANWILHLPAGISISKIVLVAYYLNKSSVSGDVNQVEAIERKSTLYSDWDSGYGSDSGGGNTVGLLKKVYNRFGVVTSFTGTYIADQWSLVIRSSSGSGYGSLISSSVAAIAQTPTAAGTPTPSSAATITPTPTAAGTPASTPVPTYSTSPSPTPNPHRQKCLKIRQNSYYCSGQYTRMKAVCKDGYCVCTGQGYNYDTCLPDAYGCKIEVNSATALAKPRDNNQRRLTTYSCTPGSSSTQYEVHILTVYEAEALHRRPPVGENANVNIVSRGKPNTPIVLVLGSYEPVNWILKLPAGISISKVILVAYYVDESSVTGDINQVKAIERKGWRNSEWRVGWGSDSGGGDTVALLKQVNKRYGVVTSFTSTYRADEWSLELSSLHGSGYGNLSSSSIAAITPTPTAAGTPASTPVPTYSTSPSPTPNPHRQKCLKIRQNSYYCSGQYTRMKAVCKDGYCVCTGQGYNYDTCLPDAYGCKIEVNSATALAKPNNQQQLGYSTYSCTPSSSSTQYEVHVLSVYQVINRRPPTAGNANVNIVSRGKSNRPIVLVLASYEPVNWILHLPAGISISKIVLVAYYLSKSSVSGDVNQVQAIERKSYRNSEWPRGHGSDSGGGDTVGLLKKVYNRFGVVTSFTGTNTANQWSLVVRSSSAARTPASTPVPTYSTSPSPTPNPHGRKCLKIRQNSYYCPGQHNNMKAVCKDGYCVCTGQGYNYDTCLPDAYGCKIEVNSATALAKAEYKYRRQRPTYSCTPASSSTQYEVHILTVYEVINRRPPTAGNAIVNIVSSGKSNRPICLVLGNYEPVNWILKLPAGTSISKVILVAYYVDESSVAGDINQVKAIERKGWRNSEWRVGLGSDSGGGDTVALLKQVNKRYGVVTSFTSTYRADEWSLELSSLHGSGYGNLSSSSVTAITQTPTAAGTPTPSSAATITPTPTAAGTPVSTPVPTYSTSPSPTPNPHRQKCYKWQNSFYCTGQYTRRKAVCKDGYCVCTGQGYNYDTCLPDAYGCKIEVNSVTAHAKPNNQQQQGYSTYSCTPSSSSTQYEVHVLSVYEVINRRPPTSGNANVNIVSRGKSNRPIVLVLASYEPVNWILHLPVGISISKVVLVSHYLDKSSVSGDVNQVKAIEQKSYHYGYGSDSGGGNTVELLKKVYNRFGVVTSFTGTYIADEWSLVIRSSSGLGYGNLSSSSAVAAIAETPTAAGTPTPSSAATITPTPTAAGTPASTPVPTYSTSPSPTPNPRRQKCYKWQNSFYCTGQYSKMKAVCKDGYCVCTGQGYNYDTCLPDVYGCKIEVNSATALAKPRYNNQQRQTTYSCTPDSSSTQYEVHVLSVYEVINRRPPTAGNAIVNIVSRGKSKRPIVLVLGSYEPVNWILNLPAGISISNVVLVAYYLDQSSVSGDVNQVEAIERKGLRNSEWKVGWGSDSGGGDTVALLKQVYNRFGVVTSFTSTYRANKWSLELSSSHGLGLKHITSGDSSLSESVQELAKMVKQLKQEVESQENLDEKRSL